MFRQFVYLLKIGRITEAELIFSNRYCSKLNVEPNPARWGGETSVTFVFSKSKTKTMQKKQQHCSVLH
jgi:hypothetical protein